MKSLCTCAALAVATAIAHGSFADALAPAERAARSAANATKLEAIDTNKSCTTEINAFRGKLGLSQKPYSHLAAADPANDLRTFLQQNNCDALKAGTFTHIAGDSSDLFVISATRPTPESGSDTITCADALKAWESGFTDFGGKTPGPFTDNEGEYSKPNAVGLVSLLNDESKNIYCGIPADNSEYPCGKDTVICYIKDSGITPDQAPVNPQVWRKVEETMKFRPKLEAHADGQAYVKAVNALREVDDLGLPAFTAASNPSVEDALNTLTCADIKNSKIDPSAVDGYTLIYAVKDGDAAPSAEEAAATWKNGATKVGVEIPPAFTKGSEDDIYYDNAVAGFVSIMVDATRGMKCYNATGCDSSALICLLKEPTLVGDKQPISEETWKKVLAVYVEKIGFTDRGEDSCLTEINGFRAQDGLELKPFAALTNLTPSESTAISQGVTCEALRSGNAPFLFGGDNPLSLMYYYGEPATCSAAVRGWKNGIDLFKDVTIPPKYSADEPLYKNGAATNFISLVSEGADTKIACYTVTGCRDPALLCVLQPPVFKDGVAPISEETWQKVTDTVTSGAAAASAYGALLSSVFVAVGLFALSF